jgi:TIR domain
MTHVFLSHAAADKPLADDLKTFIQTSVGLPPSEIFYTSGKGTGIPNGQPFVQYIGEKMRASAFVIAVITPAYLESQFCLAELGAVWVTADKDFFPVCVPQVDRAQLKATLTGIQVEKLDQAETLAELSQRLCAFRRQQLNAAASVEAGQVFLRTLPSRLDGLKGATKVPAEALEVEKQAAANLAAQLTKCRDELTALQQRYEDLKAAKTAEEVEALEPEAAISDEIERLIEAARAAVNSVSKITRDALPFALRGEGMPWPDAFSYEYENVRNEVDRGYLYDGDDGCVYPNVQWQDIKDALDALRELQKVLQSLTGEDEKWFARTYRVPADLSQTAVFDTLL